MPWYADTMGGSLLSLPNGSLYLTEVQGGFRLEYRTTDGHIIRSWVVNVPSLYEARRLSMDMVRNYLLGEVQYLETTNPTVGVNYACDSPTYTGCGKPKVGCAPSCGSCKQEVCKCKRVYATIATTGGNCAHH